MQTAIGVIGYPSSGKSQLTEIAVDCGFTSVVMGDAVREKAKDRWSNRIEKADKGVSDETVSDVYGEFASTARKKEGSGVVARWCVSEIEQIDGPVLIDGLRSVEECQVFEQVVNVKLVFVHAPAVIRLERMQNRGRDGEDTFTADGLLQRDARENQWGLDELVQHADCTIHNCTTEASFHENARAVVRSLSPEV